MRRARLVGMLSAAALASGMLAVPGPAAAASAVEAKVLALTNGVRASSGLPALGFDDALAANARTWAAKMAADGVISHNRSLSSQITGWSKLSENVGQGPDIDTVHRALVASPPHYRNMTDTEVSMMGVGVAHAGDSVYLVEVFMGRAGAAVGKPPAVAPPAAVAKAPATTAPKAPAAPKATTTTTMPTSSTTVAVVAATETSPWMTLALEATRAWEGASGVSRPSG